MISARISPNQLSTAVLSQMAATSKIWPVGTCILLEVPCCILQEGLEVSVANGDGGISCLAVLVGGQISKHQVR